MKIFFIGILLFALPFASSIIAQEVHSYNIIIDEIGSLESSKDPKCHATAARLEDFIYGTPLDSEARSARIEFQQNFVIKLIQRY